MGPSCINDTIIKQCELEAQKLFEVFLDVSDAKYQSKETNEVQYQVRERDSQVRSGSFGSSSSLSSSYVKNDSLAMRGPGDLSYYKEEIEKKRRSLEVATPPRYGSSPALSTLESDSASYLSFTAVASSPPNGFTRDTKSASSGRRRASRPQSGPQPYEAFPSEQERRSRSNTGPTEEQLLETARTIASIGDSIEREHKERLNKFHNQMVTFLAENASISYEVFAAHVNDMIGQDRNWTNLLFIMHLGKRVVRSSYSISAQTRSFFARFVGNAFGEEIARSGSTNQYVREHVTESGGSTL